MGTVGIGHDVTDFSNTDIELGILIDNMPIQMIICDINWKVVRINDQFKLTFNEEADFMSKDFRQWKNSTFAVIKNLENTDDGHGNYQELTFDDVYNPAAIQAEIFSRFKRFKHTNEQSEQEKLADWIATYDEMRREKSNQEENDAIYR